jgi:altronate hydrolase
VAARAVLLDDHDSVAVAVAAIQSGSQCDVTGAASLQITTKENIPGGHKIALKKIKKGEHILKYGHSIGVAQKDIEEGSWIHSHNLASGLHGTLEYTMPEKPFSWNGIEVKGSVPKTFKGYRRADGSVGIRNELWVIPVVGCVNKSAERITERAKKELGCDAVCFSHPYGCSQLGDDLDNTKKILAGLVRHPNAGGVLVVALGCENLTLDIFKKELGSYDERRVKFLHMQEAGDEESEGLKLLSDLNEYAAIFKREDIFLNELVIGMKCGGSDGFSGITANPLVGRVADILIQQGGSVICTEVPEMFGAETVLMNRACSREIFDSTVALVNDFKDYFIRHGQEVYENPSPGNRDGGITTLEEKSLGCTRKSGTSAVMDVIPYGAQRRKKGLTLLSGPGNDLVSTTVLSAAGVHIILFTTGRGTPFGAPATTMKISTNSDLARRKPGWIDFDAGALLTGKSFDELGLDLLNYIIQTASGEKTKSESTGNRDIAIFKDGVTL